MKILVIGSSGQVARALSAQAGGHEVIRAGRPQIDLASPTGLADLIGQAAPDAIINAAAYTAVDKAEEDIAAARALNETGPAALARTAQALAVPFIHISTDYVFNGLGGAPYAETAGTAPLNVYGQTKADGEKAVLAVNPAALIVRTSWVYAPEGQNFVRTMLRLAAARDQLNVVEDQIGRPTEAHALADALLVLAEHLRGGAEGGLLHVTNAGEASWRDLAEAAVRGAGLSTPIAGIPTSAYPTPARRPGDTRLDISKAERDFGIVLPDWRESLDRCLEMMGVSGRRA
ncbi:dTDP-4-dehydrorhamnose reductase [Hyphobacterium sp. HN65]|uniref:dTDP-4-dehydrorhamnose reductase n=1 Tax=Hyphobacterium lacteum TaxID=3116575 RepID=A0ABU7LP37_9PROT|nr:dTDP-4-dehydrorhamnose reductase [Hyphobacterium sp. HN65]MEE2525643.1 dTDP-4-dehydrorhamnose reductase [Hyphobacterium sp. HN65]